MPIIDNFLPGAYRASLSRLAHTRLRTVAAAMLMSSLVPVAANAQCELSETEVTHGAPGIPADAVMVVDPGGVRRALGRNGIETGGIYYGESFGNWGGFDQGVEYDGVLELYLKADMHRLGLWRGLCFHADGFQIHGNAITANIGSLMPVSSVEATDATRLFELWFEQHLFNDKLAVKLGQLAADAEFVISDGGGYFLNATWGWPSITAADLPSGGPAYPLATPGVRVALHPNEKFDLLVGVYNGDPAPACASDDPQVCNPHGLNFELDDPPLLMAEGAYTYNQNRLAGTVKVGGWNHFGTFEDQRFDQHGGRIAVTGNDGRPLDHNWGFYGIIDQLVWRVPGSEEAQGVGVFARVIGAPSDRNVVDFYFDGGVTFTGMFRNRPNDALAVGFAYTGISDRASGFDVDADEPVVRNYEALIEICHTVQLRPGWTLHLDLQYIWQPGGNVTDDSGRRIENAAVIGARTTSYF